jgi:hypothetical protein
MTKARFSQADLARAVRVADQLGKVALWTPSGIAFVQSDAVSLPVPEQARGNSCDEAFGVGS